MYLLRLQKIIREGNTNNMSYLKGTLHVQQTTCDVYAQDDLTLKLYLTATNDELRMLWDTAPVKKTGGNELIVGDFWRRIDISTKESYNTNIPNRTYTNYVAAALRFLLMYSFCVDTETGRPFYDNVIPVGTTNTLRRYRIVNSACTAAGIQGDYYTRNKEIIKLSVSTPYMSLVLEECDALETAWFAPCKYIGVKGGTSRTKVSRCVVPLIKNTLGLDLADAVPIDTTVDLMSLYNNMDEVIEAHPQKDFRWLRGRKYEIVTPENFEQVLSRYYAYDGMIAIDTETTGLKINYLSRTGQGDQLTGICLSMKTGEAHYFPLQMHYIKNLCGGDHFYFMQHYMRDFLQTHKFVTHHNQFDWKVFYIYDINLNTVFDTYIAYQITKHTEFATFECSLKTLTGTVLGLDQVELDDLVRNGDWSKSGMSFADLPYDLCKFYAPTDADMTLSLYEVIKNTKLIEKYDAQKTLELEVKFSKVAAYSEFWGYPVNVAKLPEMERTTQDEIDELYQKMVKIVGHDFNPRSAPQLLKILYEELKYPVMGGGKPSTNKETLKELAEVTDMNDEPVYPLAACLHKYRQLSGIVSNFLKRKDEYITVDGVIFPSVKPLGARTGRCSVTEPNYQSYNDVVKKNIVPRPGFKMWDCDFSQIEYRTLSSMAHEQMLVDAFADPDTDYHTLQASRMFKVPYAAVTGNIRQQAKRINFALPYGMGDESLGANIFGKRCKENTIKARELRDLYFEGQDNVRNFFETVRDNGVANGYTTTLFGRRRYYPVERGADGKVKPDMKNIGRIRRQAGNAVIQGCLSGDTRIQTKEYGIVKIKDVVDCHLNVWDGKQWTAGDILYSGKKRKCIIRFNNGMTMVTSPIHKFLVRSAKGHERFVACQNLLTSATSANPHRVVINPEYVASDYKYSPVAHNANNVFLEDLKDSHAIGVVLGRLASDDTYQIRTAGAASILQEVCELNIKHRVHDNIFMDTELLRGFLCGFFDGNGEITGKSIEIVFGTQYDFEPMCRDLQKALLFFGIRSHYRRNANNQHVICIKANDNARFLELIGFTNTEKQTKGTQLVCKTNEHVFGKCLIVESVEITDEYIDMYDVCNTERGYYVADGVVTHNTAADIYKIACCNMFDMVCAKGWLGKVLFDGFIHDEILGEVSEEVNFDEFIAGWHDAFEVKLDGFCRLYAGFGIGESWYQAKKQDLHPLFIQELIDTAPTRKWDGNGTKYINETVIEGFHKHKIRRVKDYITDPAEQGVIIKPIILTYLIDYTTEYIQQRLQQDIASGIVEFSEILGRQITQKDAEDVLHGCKKPLGITNLQEWLKVYCVWQSVDYNSIKILSADDMQQEKMDKQKEQPSEQEQQVDDVNLAEAMRKGALTSFGFYFSPIDKRVYLNADCMNMQSYTLFKQKFAYSGTGYQIVLYSNRTGTPVYKLSNDFMVGEKYQCAQTFMIQLMMQQKR